MVVGKEKEREQTCWMEKKNAHRKREAEVDPCLQDGKKQHKLLPVQGSMEQLSSDVRSHLSTFLHGKELLQLSCVNSLWRSAVLFEDQETDALWKTIFSQEFSAYEHLSKWLEQGNNKDNNDLILKYRQLLSITSCQKAKWSVLDTGTNAPCARQGSAGDALGSYMVVYGGWANAPQFIRNDLYVIDTRTIHEELTWMELRPLGEAPPRTYGHTITTCRLKGILCMLVFAGLESGGYFGESNHVSLLRATNNDVSLDHAIEIGSTLKWQRIITPSPSTPRAYHSMTWVPQQAGICQRMQGCFLVFGGFGSGAPLTALELLTPSFGDEGGGEEEEGNMKKKGGEGNMKKGGGGGGLDGRIAWSWEKPVTYGSCPSGRFGHSASIVADQLFLLGGCNGSHNHKGHGTSGSELCDVHILDLRQEPLQWSQPVTSGADLSSDRILGRCHSASVVGSKLLVFGGGPSSRLSNKFVVLDTSQMTWKTPRLYGAQRCLRRQNHVAAMIDSRLFIFGGWNRVELNQFSYFELDDTCQGFEPENIHEGSTDIMGPDEEEEEEREEHYADPTHLFGFLRLHGFHVQELQDFLYTYNARVDITRSQGRDENESADDE